MQLFFQAPCGDAHDDAFGIVGYLVGNNKIDVKGYLVANGCFVYKATAEEVQGIGGVAPSNKLPCYKIDTKGGLYLGYRDNKPVLLSIGILNGGIVYYYLDAYELRVLRRVLPANKTAWGYYIHSKGERFLNLPAQQNIRAGDLLHEMYPLYKDCYISYLGEMWTETEKAPFCSAVTGYEISQFPAFLCEYSSVKSGGPPVRCDMYAKNLYTHITNSCIPKPSDNMEYRLKISGGKGLTFGIGAFENKNVTSVSTDEGIFGDVKIGTSAFSGSTLSKFRLNPVYGSVKIAQSAFNNTNINSFRIRAEPSACIPPEKKKELLKNIGIGCCSGAFQSAEIKEMVLDGSYISLQNEAFLSCKIGKLLLTSTDQIYLYSACFLNCTLDTLTIKGSGKLNLESDFLKNSTIRSIEIANTVQVEPQTLQILQNRTKIERRG